jgi:hypothetical protein
VSHPNNPNVPPGWYPDGQGSQRWWDGTQWTEHVQPAAPQQPAQPPAPQQQPAAPQQHPAAPQPGYGPPQAQQSGHPGQQPGYPQSGQPGQPPHGQPQWNPTGQPGPQGAGGGGNKKLFVILGAAGGGALLLLILVVVLVMTLSGNNPKGVADDYLKAVKNENYSRICELMTDEAQQELYDEYDAENCREVGDALKDQEAEREAERDGDAWEIGDVNCSEAWEQVDYDYEIVDVEEDGDDATVTVEVVGEYGGDASDAETCYINVSEMEEGEEFELELVKENGDWRVAPDNLSTEPIDEPGTIEDGGTGPSVGSP